MRSYSSPQRASRRMEALRAALAACAALIMASMPVPWLWPGAMLDAQTSSAPTNAPSAPAPAALPAQKRVASASKKPAASQKKPAAGQPAVQATATAAPQPATPAAPAAPKPADWPVNDSAVPASVVYDSRGLLISASNSSLAQILKEVATDTGANLEGMGQDQRVFGTYGPGPARDVLSQLLDGSGYNVLLIGDRGEGTPRRIVLSSQAGANAPGDKSSPAAAASNDDNDADQPEPQAEQDQQQPPQQPPNGAPGGVRTPAQLMQELQQRDRQLQQQQQQQSQQQNPQ